MIFEFKGRHYRRMSATDQTVFGKRAKVISLGKLSSNALKLYERLIQGRFYNPHSPNLPKAMQELIANGLVSKCGRVVVIELCFVPAHGYTPFQEEKFE